MKFSVITVVFNAVATVADAVRSVQSQTHPDVQHIIIDGASTDGTLDVLHAILNDCVLLISEPDKGIYDAMNKGLARADGEVICFLNADDVYAHSDVLSQVNTILAKGSDALYGDVAYFRADAPEKMVRRYRSGRFRPDRIAYGWMPAHPALFLRQTVYEHVGLFRTDYSIAGDFEFIARAFGGGTLRLEYLPEILVRMRMGGVSTANWRSKVVLNREVLRACRENGVHTNMLKILSKYPLKLLELLS